MNKAYIDEECIMCSTYGKFLSNRSSDVLILNQSELSIEDIKRDEIVYFRNNKKFYGAEAFIQSTSDLGGIYKTVILFKVFPIIYVSQCIFFYSNDIFICDLSNNFSW